MELYVRFMFTLAVGLAGVVLVLTTLFETILRAWDPVRDFRRWWRRHHHYGRSSAGSVRAADILSELEARYEGRYAPTSPSRALDRRREVLRDMREAEQRASSSAIAEAL